MLLSTIKRVDQIVTQGLCTGCGSCIAACPQGSITMKETSTGLLAPEINSSSCNECGLCTKVCPGDHFEQGMIADGTDMFTGPIRACCLLQNRQDTLLTSAQSGGAVTGLLLHLLDRGFIERALVTVMPRDGSLRPYPILTKNPKMIRKSCGSKYCPVPLNTQLKNIDPKERIAVVGLPCHLQGVAHLCRHLPHLQRKNFLFIGLVCDRVLSFRAMDYLVHRAGLHRQDVKYLRFRSKQRKGWPGDVQIIMQDGKSTFLPARERIACKDFFTPHRCRLCFDKMNILSDITCSDPYGLSKDVKGQSAVIVRSSTGQAAIQSAIQAGIFTSCTISADDLLAGQKIENKRRDYASYVTLWRIRGRVVPKVPIMSKHQPDTQSPIERHIYKKHLFDFPELIKDSSTFRQNIRHIRWTRRMRLLSRLDHLLFGNILS